MNLQDLCRPLPPSVKTLLVNVLVPSSEGTAYARKDIILNQGKIAAIEPAHSVEAAEGEEDIEIIDCTERMILPGFVNAHSHSIEHWARGLIQPMPLELWLMNLFDHEPRGKQGWHGADSFVKTPAWAVGLSALHSGLEALLSGCTAVMDHLFVRDIDDIEQAVVAYKALGMRSFLAPMLGDDANMHENYYPLAADATARNEGGGCACGAALREDGCFREAKGASNPETTQAVLDLYEDAVLKFHDPDKGINIAIGPTAVHSCSMELLKGATALRKKYNLCGHTHLLETRAQALMAKQFFPSQSAVKQLRESGFLDLPGTSCAHTVWLTDEEWDIMAETGAVCVHNPLSNLRLGSGIIPLISALDKNVTIAMGCDGSCSSDGQDILEALKLATILSTMATPEYRKWLTPRQIALNLATKNGYKALGMSETGGEIKVGMVADVTLWDLTSLALLPRTDPLSLLIMGSRCQAPGAGSTLDCVWVRGQKVVAGGSPLGVDIEALRATLIKSQPDYRDSKITDPKADPKNARAEVEYRAAMGLDADHQQHPTPVDLGSFPNDRVLYDSTIP
jgi:5-methylthioadenosine/S-adenosylhomocysteine deaminase